MPRRTSPWRFRHRPAERRAKRDHPGNQRTDLAQARWWYGGRAHGRGRRHQGDSTLFAFPVVGGEVNKQQLSGRIVHSGGLAITAGGTTLIVKRFVINLDTGYLTAKVAGAGVRIPLLRLGAITGGVKAAPGVLVLKDVNVRLPGTAAGALNQTFNTDLFSGGLLIGHRHRHHQGLEPRAKRNVSLKFACVR